MTTGNPVSEVYNGGGNPYGASYVTEGGIHGARTSMRSASLEPRGGA